MTGRALAFLAALLLPVGVGAAVTPEAKLRELDAVLRQREAFDARKEEGIARLRSVLRGALNDDERWNATHALFDEYASYKYDSAYAYALRLREVAVRMDSPDRLVEAGCAKVFCLISAGLYKEAFDAVDSIRTGGLSPRALLEYSRIQVRLNFSAKGYAPPHYREAYSRAGEAYIRQILDLLPEQAPLWKEYHANLLMESGRFEESIAAFSDLLEDGDLDLHSRAIYASSMGWMQLCLGREEDAIVSLAESAICDTRSSTKETTALRMLADLLSRRGEVERPLRYVRQSFEDADFYDARLRKLEVGAVLPLVERNHAESLNRERNLLAAGIVLAVALMVAAGLALGFIRRQNRRLDEARRTIEERNRQLERANARLAEADAIKTEYIGNSFYVNAQFIDKMEQLCKMVDRMIVTRQWDELRRSLKESAIDKERDEMYASFDGTFLKIFPTFINDYNALFPASAQQHPAGRLTPEMRIFALIRLGITESERIARFLDYSVHTINTYKTRVKNRSWVENDRFEAEIMRIGGR